MEIIKNFTAITNVGAVFPVGNTVSVQDGGGVGVDRSSGRTMVAVATLDSPIEKPFAVYDMLQLYSALGTFDQPQIEVDENGGKLIVTNAGANTGKFVLKMGSPEVVKAPGQIKFPDDVENITFRLTAETYQRVFRGISIVNTEKVIVYGQDGDLYIAAHDDVDKSANTYVTPVGKTNATFSIIVKVDNLNKLIKSIDYDITIAQSGIMRASSVNESIKIDYFIAGSFN